MLAEREVDELFRVIRSLKEKGLAIIYISHRLAEIFELCDSVTVLKDGRNAGDAATAETSEQRLISMMVGRTLSGDHFDGTRRLGEQLLRANGVTNRHLTNCSLAVRAGEIVGIYGLVGSGRTELAQALFGRDATDSGKIFIRGQVTKLKTPQQAIDLGLSLIPEDRRRHGLALQLSVNHNLNLPLYRKQHAFGLVNLRKERETSSRMIRRLAIRTPSLRQRVRNLSGGNQQKVVVGKWLANESERLGKYVADEDGIAQPLSNREMEVLECLTLGMSNKEIAVSLTISHQTVKNHITSILRKIGVDDRTQAAIFALKQGWIRLYDHSDN